MLDEDFSSAAGPDWRPGCLNFGASTQDIKATTTKCGSACGSGADRFSNQENRAVISTRCQGCAGLGLSSGRKTEKAIVGHRPGSSSEFEFRVQALACGPL